MPITSVRAAAECMPYDTTTAEILIEWAKLSPAEKQEVLARFKSQNAKVAPPSGNITRRHALAVTGSGFIAALATTAGSTTPAPAAQSGLPAIIEAHRLAYAVFNASLDVEWAMEASYFERNRKEILVPLSIGGAQTFHVRDDLKEQAAECKAEIDRRYAEQAQKLRGLANIEPALVEQANASLAQHRAADLRSLRRLVRAEEAKRDAHGYGPALCAREEASEAERDALTAVCAFCCTSADEYAMKGRYLLSATGGKFGDLQPEDYDALLRSFLSDGEA